MERRGGACFVFDLFTLYDARLLSGVRVAGKTTVCVGTEGGTFGAEVGVILEEAEIRCVASAVVAI